MADYAVMPVADYQDACNAVREKTGGKDVIKSGDIGGQIRSIDTQENLDEELTTQDSLIAQITAALEGKMVPSGTEIDTSTVTISQYQFISNVSHIVYTTLENGLLAAKSLTNDSGFTLPYTLNDVPLGTLIILSGGDINNISSTSTGVTEIYQNGSMGRGFSVDAEIANIDIIGTR